MSPKERRRYWGWLVLAMLICQESPSFPRVTAAKREPRKKPKDPNQYTGALPNTTLSNSEELNGHAKGNRICNPFFHPEATERRASPVLPAHPSEIPVILPPLEEISFYRRVEEAFHCKLKGQIIVDKKTLMELQNFQMPLAKGAFLRGSGLNLTTGRFTASVSGIYQFSANVHVDHSELKSKLQLRARDNVRVLICIESLCHRYTSLEVIAGLESNSKVFTVYVHGLLQLQILLMLVPMDDVLT
ncbi:PREDICTED: adipolin [Thamnophis sirtalis]|uniref:Adipolin n=1 Tax=Thamnophis sirtalis TaxID=35019 RepID=A0A6I9XDC4_9SAUR|nr:PREDICTED: adipolin [Thamnophis sirtalis]